MLLSMNKTFRLLSVVIVLMACAYQPPQQLARSTSITPLSSSPLFNLSAKEFWGLGVAEQTVEGRGIDQTLLSAAVFHETNVRRQQAGRNTLRHDARLDRAARLHADRMVEDRFFDHINPSQADLRTPKDRVLSVGFSPMYISENIATHFDIRYKDGTAFYKLPKQKGGGVSYTPNGPPITHHTYHSFAISLMDQWMASKGHRRNILSKYPTQFGAGCAIRPESSGMNKLYCVQLFGAEMN